MATDALSARRPALVAPEVRPGVVLAVASLGVFMVFLDTTIVNVAFPDILADFDDTGLDGLSWVLNAYNVVLAAFLVVFGRVADVLGRRRTYLVGTGVFTLASVLCAVAPSVEVLVAARVLQALGGAMLVPASLALVLRAFPPEHRAHAVGLWGASAALAAGLGPTSGGLLVEASGWELTFLVNLPVGLATILAARSVLVESRAPGRRLLPDLPGSLLLAVAIGAAALGIVKGNDWGWIDPRTLSCLAFGVLTLVAFVRRSGRHRSPVVDLALLRRGDFALANGLTVAAAVGLYAAMLCNVLFLTSVWGYSELEAGLGITPGPLATAVVAGPAGKLADRFGTRAVVAPGALVWALGLAFFIIRAGAEAHYAADWLPGILLTGIGTGMVLPNLNSAAVAAAPGAGFGIAGAINGAARQLGAVLGIALLVAVVGTPGPAEAADALESGWRLAAGALVLTALVTALALRIAPAHDAVGESFEAVAPAGLVPAPTAKGDVARLDAPAARPRTSRELLAALPAFAGAAGATLDRLAAEAATVDVRARGTLFEAGDATDAVFLVLSGRLRAYDPGPPERPLGISARGAVLGEVGVLAGQPRTATVRALRDSRLLALPAALVQDLADEDTAFATGLVRELARRLRNGDSVAAGRPSLSTLAVVPAHPGVASQEVARALSGALAGDGRVALLAPPDDGPPDLDAMTETLEEGEAANDVIVLAAASPDAGDPWTRFCLGHADRVVVLAGDGPPPDWAAPDCDVVWTGRDPGAIHRIATTLDARVVHPGPERSPDALEPLVRRLGGTSVGLVLSGGGARALAHLGVLEQLEESGVSVDRVAGTGTGALVAALHATGMPAAEARGWCWEWLVRRRAMADFGRPRRALLRGARLEAMLRAAFADLLMEELPLQLRCTAADLLSREAVVLRSGPVAEAVRASMALPGLLAPVVRDEQLLVDGGVLDNLPVGALDEGEGPVIVVDVTPERRRAADDEALPWITETLQRSLVLGSADTQRAHARARLVVRPAVRDFGTLEYHLLDELAEAGRQAARDALRDPGARDEQVLSLSG